MNMNLFNHNNNTADDYVQLNSCGCCIVRLAKPALKTIHSLSHAYSASLSWKCRKTPSQSSSL